MYLGERGAHVPFLLRSGSTVTALGLSNHRTAPVLSGAGLFGQLPVSTHR